MRYYVFSVDPQIGSPYLAMEYVDGEPLSDVLKRGRWATKRSGCCNGGLPTACGRARLGIVHRDISPDNVILPGQVGRAKIIDFGIARSTLARRRYRDRGRSRRGVRVHVARAARALRRTVTPKSDIYSLGLVLAEALAGGLSICRARRRK